MFARGNAFAQGLRITGAFAGGGHAVKAGYECFPHDADIGVRGFGETMAQAFEQAAMAMTSVIAEPASVRPEEGPIALHCEAPDDCMLLADWLNLLIYEMAVRQMLFSRFEVEISEHRLEARVWGERLDRVRHAPAVEIKGATYTGIDVSKDPDGHWVASCIVDV